MIATQPAARLTSIQEEMEMARTFTLNPISPNDLHANDLREELEIAYDTFGVETDKDDAPIAAFRLWVDDSPNAYEVLVIDTRVGIFLGGNSEWGDINGDLETAIDDYLNDYDAWERRN